MKCRLCRYMWRIIIIIINGIFTQDNPSVLSTVINGVLLTNKLEIIKI